MNEWDRRRLAIHLRAAARLYQARIDELSAATEDVYVVVSVDANRIFHHYNTLKTEALKFADMLEKPN